MDASEHLRKLALAALLSVAAATSPPPPSHPPPCVASVTANINCPESDEEDNGTMVITIAVVVVVLVLGGAAAAFFCWQPMQNANMGAKPAPSATPAAPEQQASKISSALGAVALPMMPFKLPTRDDVLRNKSSARA